VNAVYGGVSLARVDAENVAVAYTHHSTWITSRLCQISDFVMQGCRMGISLLENPLASTTGSSLYSISCRPEFESFELGLNQTFWLLSLSIHLLLLLANVESRPSSAGPS
jgi:hypothetical protein